jgi:hypothetical protein
MMFYSILIHLIESYRFSFSEIKLRASLLLGRSSTT